MKKKMLFTICCMSLLLNACTPQNFSRKYGGDMLIELPSNQKLEEITWKDDSLWYLVRPMTEDDIAETHVFKQSSPLGIIDGSVTIVEKKEENE